VKWPPTKRTVALIVVIALLVVGGLLAPHLLQWFIGGAAGGALALGAAQKARRKGDRDHRKNIEKERKEVETLQKEAEEAVSAATDRGKEDPNAEVAGLTIEERRERLRNVAERLTGEET
jgi:hypothetical protein